MKYHLILLFIVLSGNTFAGSEKSKNYLLPIPTIDIINKNIPTPLYNLHLLSELSENKSTDLLSNLSAVTYSNTESFLMLKEHISHYQLNTSYVKENRTNDFSVNDNMKNRFTVSFERRKYGKWYVTSVKKSVNGQLTLLPFAENDPILTTGLSSQSGDFHFREFPLLWNKIKDKSIKLTPLKDQSATLEEIFFYNDSNKISIASIKLAYFGPTRDKIENGWLITEAAFKDYDFNRKSDYIPPILTNQFSPSPPASFPIQSAPIATPQNLKLGQDTAAHKSTITHRSKGSEKSKKTKEKSGAASRPVAQ